MNEPLQNTLLPALEQYYRSKGIAALDFRCPFFQWCSRGSPTFTPAVPAYVSSGYEARTLPRILVLSSDSGSGFHDPQKRTLEYKRWHEEEVYRLSDGGSNYKSKHWYLTHWTVWQFLLKFDPSLQIEQVKHYFAHTNSAKCSENNPGRKQAGDLLFKNCRGYLPEEIEILAPEIVITQGEKARQVLLSFRQPPEEIKRQIFGVKVLPEAVQVVEINHQPTLWVHSYHPNQRQGFFRTRTVPLLPTFTSLAQEFIEWKNQGR